MMNSVTEDIFDWLREYFPDKMKNNLYDIDEVENLYLKGKESQVGKFKENDILSYDYLDRGDMKTAVVIFKSHSRLENGDSKITVEGYFCYKTYVGCTDIYSNDKIVLELACTSPETNFVYFFRHKTCNRKREKQIFRNNRKAVANKRKICQILSVNIVVGNVQIQPNSKRQ